MSQFSHSAGGVVLHPTHGVLLVQQRDGTWSFPKGGVQLHEEPSDAALREIAEETGLLHVHIVKLLKSYTRFGMTRAGEKDEDRVWRITMYLCGTESVDLRPADPRVAEAVWLPLETVADRLTHPKDRAFWLEVLPELVLLQRGRVHA